MENIWKIFLTFENKAILPRLKILLSAFCSFVLDWRDSSPKKGSYSIRGFFRQLKSEVYKKISDPEIFQNIFH